nr:RNA-directed DNA polymerase, eukaryota [Tanacetum cinerariifolium]
MQSGIRESESSHALVLNDECLLSKDLSKSLFGREEMCFHSKRLCIHTKIGRSIFEEFKIIFHGKVFWIRAKEAPRWVPESMEESDDEEHNDDDSKDGGFNVHESGSCGGDSDVEGVPKTLFEEIGQKKNNLDEEPTDQQENHSEDPFSIYTVLKKKKDIAENENNSNHSLKGSSYRWITSEFDGRTGDSRASHGIQDGWMRYFCVWDPNSFRKSNATVYDYFIMIRGVWRQTGNDLLIIMVYAPHDLKDKHMLRDYLTREIVKWKGEVVIIDDFNEVWYKSDRFGLVFNVQGANVFNSFITNAGLEE